eukprot:CAMPEP_0180044492 /NCGR_PEP_ID=MMETSP0984-20121128/35954_1 /TAXON_ID=483367 /ORGANISM="non described non described, Strain CCMP 2436" /LENGTH=149 /DNA_ID=CAMNT_0021972667 /DNA_START=195 /DNA_END=645 /DNA_ORIENTATION=+
MPRVEEREKMQEQGKIIIVPFYFEHVYALAGAGTDKQSSFYVGAQHLKLELRHVRHKNACVGAADIPESASNATQNWFGRWRSLRKGQTFLTSTTCLVPSARTANPSGEAPIGGKALAKTGGHATLPGAGAAGSGRSEAESMHRPASSR